MAITLADVKDLAPILALAALVWKGSAIVSELRAAIAALTTSTDALSDEIKSHAAWRKDTDARLVALERSQAVESATDDIEKEAIRAALASVRSHRAVSATEHQEIDQDALRARRSRKKKP